MEKQFFDWEAWDQFDTIGLQFENCTLKVDVGPHKAGEKIGTIAVNYETGDMKFYDEEGNVTETYKIELAIKKD